MPRRVELNNGGSLNAFFIFAITLVSFGFLSQGWAVETIAFKSDQEGLTSNGGPDLSLAAAASEPAAASGTDAGETDAGDQVAGRANVDEVRRVAGEIILESQDGGVMMLADDGRIWTIQPDQIVDRSADDEPLDPLGAEEVAKRILGELPPGFGVYRTANYTIVHNTNEAYVKRVGMLFEQLHRGFYAYWKNQRWELPPPRFPLVALVFANHEDFLQYAVAEVGETGKSVIGYYHLATNRMTTFNVPNLERNIATLIHEATHQLAYNAGLQRRYADNPMWVSEGLATFFEAPDFDNPRGWRTIGRVNQVNLARWKKYLPHRPADSLATLLSDDGRFRQSASATDAYAEGWALTYFLLKTRRDQYVAYLRTLSEGKPLVEKSPRERIEEFEAAFDTTLAELDPAFVAYMHRVR